MTARLQTYAPGRACTKCGDREADTTYLHGSDLLRRQCRVCDWTWDELPLDRPEATP